MFVYEKKLQYPVRIANPNPKLAAFIISQYGGPDGELGASLRYLSQRYSMPYLNRCTPFQNCASDNNWGCSGSALRES